MQSSVQEGSLHQGDQDLRSESTNWILYLLKKATGHPHRRGPQQGQTALQLRSAVSLQTLCRPRQLVYTAWWHTTSLFVRIIHTHTLGCMTSLGHVLCLGSQASEVLVDSWAGVVPLEGACDDCDHVSRVQTALCKNWDTSQIVCKDSEGGMGWGRGRGRKFRPQLPKADRVLKFQSPPTPSSAVGTGCPRGKESDEMWGNHVAWRVRAERPPHGPELHTQKGGGQITGCCQNKRMFPRITVHLGAAGVRRCLVSWPAISCQTGRTKWDEMKVQGSTQLAVVKVG